MTGRIHSFQSLGTVDGPGVRFVAFLQGCALRCGYCHNPDTWSMDEGQKVSVEEVLRRIRRAQPYFGADGGVTLSGGEPLLQSSFVTALFTACKEESIHTCVDTAGVALSDEVKAALSVTDLCLLDVKMTTPGDYARYTGGSLETTLRFLDYLEREKKPVWIRHVVVGGLNDTREDIQRLCDLLSPYSCIEKIELLPFHKMCIEKYRAQDIPFPFEGYEPPGQEVMETLNHIVRQRW